MRTNDVTQAIVVHNRIVFERSIDKAHLLLDIQVVSREPPNEKP